MCLTPILPQENINDSLQNDYRVILPEYFPTTSFVVNPFPMRPVGLVQPIDSLAYPKGILNLDFLFSTVSK